MTPTVAHYAEYAAARAALGALSWDRAGALGARLGALDKALTGNDTKRFIGGSIHTNH